MSRVEDLVPATYPYEWSKSSTIPLAEFLKKYKPSMVQDDGTKPWIWVRRAHSPSDSENLLNEDAAVEEASSYLEEVTTKVEAIKNDSSIPMRSSKKTGAKSKKEVREQLQAEAVQKLKEISQKHGYVSGKWLIFAPPDKVDMIWSRLATSLLSGPLASTSAYLTKVSTCPRDGSTPLQHLICLYMPDIYDKEAVTEVMKILLRHHGLNLTGVKSNLYTSIGLDSKHPSGLPSTTWKNTALLPDAEIKSLKDAFFANPPSEPTTTAATTSEQVQDKVIPPAQAEAKPKPKPKLKLKKTQAEDDPFASDVDDDGEEEDKRKKELKGKTASVKKTTTKTSDVEDDEEEAPSRPRKKKKT